MDKKIANNTIIHATNAINEVKNLNERSYIINK